MLRHVENPFLVDWWDSIVVLEDGTIDEDYPYVVHIGHRKWSMCFRGSWKKRVTARANLLLERMHNMGCDAQSIISAFETVFAKEIYNCNMEMFRLVIHGICHEFAGKKISIPTYRKHWG